MGSHIFRILGSEHSGMLGFKNRKIYTTLSLTNVHYRMTKLKGFIT